MRIAAVVAAATLATATGPAAAQNRAEQLAVVLAAETACELSVSPEGVAAWIEANVAEDDLDFASNLQGQQWLQAQMVEDLSDGALVAHCAQVRRSAAAHGLLAD